MAIYKEVANACKAEAISADIAHKRQSLFAASERDRVDFSNLEDVKRRTSEYLTACEQNASFPSFMGLANYGYGISRNSLYKYLRAHPGTATAEFIETARDTIADILSAASLRRDADAATAIFILKNCHGFVDKLEIEHETSTSPLGPKANLEELQRQIDGICTADED